MIDQLKPYPKMKESGVPWLGQVPEHWSVRSLGSLTSPIAKRGRPDLPLLSVVREKGVIRRSRMRDDDNHNFIPDDLSGYKVVRAGNLVINKMKAWQGSLGLAPVEGIVSPAYFVFDFNVAVPRYGEVALRSRAYVSFFARASDGVRIGQWDLSLVAMRRIPMLIPSPIEQTAIVRFLDHADRRIKRYIRAKQKLIKLLEEQKQAIIHRAVTRGLDPNVRLKPSGVEWLGDVPEHWEIYQIGHFSVVGNGSTPARGNAAYWTRGSYPWLNSSFANRPFVLEGEATEFVTEVALQECHLPIVPRDSVLIAITGQGKTRGKATIVRFQATINQHLAYVSPNQRLAFSEYLQLVLTGAYQRLRSISDDSGSTKGALTCADIKHFKVALPPLEEQAKLRAMIDARTQACRETGDRTNREIDLLREYRTRLIADVVTGKLDVREAAANLPNEPEEPDAPDTLEEPVESNEETADVDLDENPEEAET